MWAEEQNQNLKSELFEYYSFAALQVFIIIIIILSVYENVIN